MQDLSILKYYVYVQVQCGYGYEREGCQALVKDNVYGAKRWVVILDRKMYLRSWYVHILAIYVALVKYMVIWRFFGIYSCCVGLTFIWAAMYMGCGLQRIWAVGYNVYGLQFKLVTNYDICHVSATWQPRQHRTAATTSAPCGCHASATFLKHHRHVICHKIATSSAT
jgi:hypothetical protein